VCNRTSVFDSLNSKYGGGSCGRVGGGLTR